MASGSTNCSSLPNPETALAFLPPSIASQLEVARPIAAASLGAFIWDILSNVPSDYKLLFEHRITFTTVVYLLSRQATIPSRGLSIYLLSLVGDCQALQIAFSICFAIAVPLTSLLFFFRVRAVFNDNKPIVAFFGFLWVSVLAGCITVPFATRGVHIGPTVFCILTGVKTYSATGIVISAVNDTLVLVAISLRILYNASIDDNVGARVKAFWNGGALPKLSKSILQSGQQYYLITVGGNVLTMVMILTPSVKPIYRAMFTIPNVTIENCMACKVFRDIKFGVIEPSGSSLFQSSITRNGVLNSKLSTRIRQHNGPQRINVSEIDSRPTGSDSTTVELPMELNLVGGAGSRASSPCYYEPNLEAKAGNIEV
ncbi:uncharacterized protein FOMMEDRAFT_93095 [Fomitiporia mediterranea MF3/22]|uniref:uncharacterized protein n=1 Tax=Fomitiporia mediterranea (strain MF3/22) TaxID=694068 RepID=UPI00044096D9|nr:uncharacterized protein FOMMEDRAFT_93095 [Fomitiporia mediterranea MF3/22]EJC99638.1 hypothetical protein FOMMEDRAFT_93095 [Fomitiporia mediterranea MF3/22]